VQRAASDPPQLLRSKFFWVALLYFSEGFPLGVFYELFPVYFRQQGVELKDIGLISLLGLAWTVKFLWAPAIDHYRHHRLWMAAMDVAMAAVLIGFAATQGFGPFVWVAIGAFTALSATNDIAIDGYTIELLDRRELGLANGIRIGFYRVGMLAAGLVLVLSDWIDWPAYERHGGTWAIQTKRGCPMPCSYCTYPVIEGRRLRCRPASEVVDEIEEAVRRLAPRTIDVIDSTFNVPLDHALGICREIVRRRLRLSLTTMGVNPLQVTPELFEWMERAGFNSMMITPEAASPAMLESLRRGA